MKQKRTITLTTLATAEERAVVDRIARENQISRAAAIRWLIQKGVAAVQAHG